MITKGFYTLYNTINKKFLSSTLTFQTIARDYWWRLLWELSYNLYSKIAIHENIGKHLTDVTQKSRYVATNSKFTGLVYWKYATVCQPCTCLGVFSTWCQSQIELFYSPSNYKDNGGYARAFCLIPIEWRRWRIDEYHHQTTEFLYRLPCCRCLVPCQLT